MTIAAARVDASEELVESLVTFFFIQVKLMRHLFGTIWYSTHLRGWVQPRPTQLVAAKQPRWQPSSHPCTLPA